MLITEENGRYITDCSLTHPTRGVFVKHGKASRPPEPNLFKAQLITVNIQKLTATNLVGIHHAFRSLLTANPPAVSECMSQQCLRVTRNSDIDTSLPLFPHLLNNKPAFWKFLKRTLYESVMMYSYETHFRHLTMHACVRRTCHMYHYLMQVISTVAQVKDIPGKKQNAS